MSARRPVGNPKSGPERGRSRQQLLARIEELTERLREAEDGLRAIREGEVDAIVVSGSRGEQIFSLAGSDQVYRLIVQAMREAALTTTLDGTILFCNAQFGWLLGAPMDELIGRRLAELASAEDRQPIAELLREAAAGPVKRRVLFRGRSGRVPALVSATPLQQPDGPALCWVAADLTELESSAAAIQELNRRQEQLERSTERLGVLSDTAGQLLRSKEPQAIVNALCLRVMHVLRCHCFLNYLVAEDGKALRLNAYGGISERLAEGIRRLEMGQAVCGLVAASGQPKVVESVQAGGDPQTELIRSLGIDAYACNPLLSRDNVIGTLSFGSKDRPAFPEEDLALMRTIADQVSIALERARAEEALRRLNEDLEARVELRTEELRLANARLVKRTVQLRKLARELALTEQRERRRLADMLHDHLQQLLVGARYHTELLGQRSGDEMREAVAQLDELLCQSIDVSRTLTAELGPPLLHTSGLRPAFQWLAQWLKAHQNLEVCLELPAELPPMCEDVTVQLFQSVRELLFNVAKHAGVKAARLIVAEGAGMLRFQVSDAGVGFDPSLLADRAGTETFGLFSIRERLDLLGGELHIESQPGEGSCFTLSVPLAELGSPLALQAAVTPGEPGQPRPAAEAVSPLPCRIRVLLVDDHEITRKGLMQLLSNEADLEVIGDAEDGETALELAARLKPDVVVMDVSMPGMGGIEATRRIVSRDPRVKVVGLSMHEDESVGSSMRGAGAMVYLSKVGPARQLIEAVRSCGQTLSR